MNVKLILSAAALTGALAFGVPAFAQDNDAPKPMDHPMHHHHVVHHHHVAHHHHVVRHEHPMHEHHRMHHAHMHHDMSQDARERAETRRLNEEQAHKGGM